MKKNIVLPIHMKRGLDKLDEIIRYATTVFELVDARAPKISISQLVEKKVAEKKVIKILTKSDLADSKITKEWISYFKDVKQTVLEYSSMRKINSQTFYSTIILNKQDACSTLLSASNKKKIHQSAPDNIRQQLYKKMNIALVVGIPNVGKSTFINFLSRGGTKRVRTGAKPGITKGLQLLKLSDNVFLYDTPGIIYPKFQSDEEKNILAVIGALQESFWSVEEVAYYLVGFYMKYYPEILEQKYRAQRHGGQMRNAECGMRSVGTGHRACPTTIDHQPSAINCLQNTDAQRFFEMLAEHRKFLARSGELDIRRAQEVVVNDFYLGRISGVSFEKP